jgi:hypothetical protein
MKSVKDGLEHQPRFNRLTSSLHLLGQLRKLKVEESVEQRENEEILVVSLSVEKREHTKE